MSKSESEIIDAFGGNDAVAEICKPTIPAVVSGWRKRGIPRAWRSVLKMHSPHLFCELSNTKSHEIAGK